MTVRISPATNDFAFLRKSGQYYVDKTDFISCFCRNHGAVTLFTRPRRFGKTLHLSMLEHFFSSAKKDLVQKPDGTTLFDGLKVMQDQEICAAWMNQYPVISLSLKSIAATSWEGSCRGLSLLLSDLCRQFSFLSDRQELTHIDKKELLAIVNQKADEELLKLALRRLTHWLALTTHQKVILLLDEYDVPLREAWRNDYYNPMAAFMSSFLNNSLKDNNDLAFAIVTGCLLITKESLFSGLNNFKCFGISQKIYASTFGFTPEEVDTMLTAAGLTCRAETIRQWYDGYIFGTKQEIYNPWEICAYISDALLDPEEEPTSYWAQTANTDIIRELLKSSAGEGSSTEILSTLMNLVEGRSLVTTLDPFIGYNNMLINPANIWTILYMAGYLTKVLPEQLAKEGLDCPPEHIALRVPNLGIGKAMKKGITNWFGEAVDRTCQNTEAIPHIEDMCQALVDADAAAFAKHLSGILLSSLSYHCQNDERIYQTFLALLLRTRGFTVLQEQESGEGRTDILVSKVLSETGPRFAAVLELKATRKDEELPGLCDEALDQIAKRHYDTWFREQSCPSVHWGIAFCKKHCLAKVIACPPGQE